MLPVDFFQMVENILSFFVTKTLVGDPCCKQLS